MKIKELYIGFLLLISVVGYGQQDVQFTQYMYNMSIVNPAYTGSHGTLSIGMMGRSQWSGLDGAPQSMSVSINSPITKNKGLGITLLSDRIGPVKEESIFADYSYTIKTSDEGKLAFGAKAGVIFQKIDFMTLSTDMEDDPLINRENLNETYPNFGAGVFYYTDQFYAGLSMPNIIESRHFEKSNGYISDASEKMHFYLTSGYVFDFSSTLKFRPSVMMKSAQGSPVSIDVTGSFLINEKVELGVAWRVDNSVAGIMNFVIGEHMRLGYAYDHTMSNFSGFNSSSHEVFFLYDLVLVKAGSKSPRFF